MTVPIDFTSPQQAVCKMIAAGAIFTVHRGDDVLGMSFTYKIAAGGDIDRARKILAAVKSRPPVFFAAFRAHVQDTVSLNTRGAA